MPETLLWDCSLAWGAHIRTSKPSYSPGWTYRSGPIGSMAVAPTPPTEVLQSLLSVDPPLRGGWDHFHHCFSCARHSLGKEVTILQFWMTGHWATPLSPSLPHVGPGVLKHAVPLPQIHGWREVPALHGWVILKLQRNLITSAKPQFLT